MITALFIGAFLSYSMLKSKNIVNSIILHSISNIMGVIYDKYIYDILIHKLYVLRFICYYFLYDYKKDRFLQ